jgi:TRAP-type C4-dicarboxylate transport system permease small subunit
VGLNRKFSSWSHLLNFLYSLPSSISYIALIGITALTVVDALLRSFLGISIGGVPEACTYLLVLLGFLGIAITQSAQGHIEVTFLSDRLPQRVKYYLRQIIKVILIFICLLFIYAGILKGVSAYRSNESNWFGTHILPVWFFRLAVPIGFGLLMMEFLRDLFRNKKGRMEEEEKSNEEI